MGKASNRESDKELYGEYVNSFPILPQKIVGIEWPNCVCLLYILYLRLVLYINIWDDWIIVENCLHQKYVLIKFFNICAKIFKWL